jgi:hypothetical protein
MAGTIKGGKQAAVTNMKRHGADFYRRIGSMGGKSGTTGGFGNGEVGRELARRAGAKGGRISKRRPATPLITSEELQELHTQK